MAAPVHAAPASALRAGASSSQTPHSPPATWATWGETEGAARGRALRRRAKKALELPARTRAHTGAVSVVQRGDSALRLNVHLNRVSG